MLEYNLDIETRSTWILTTRPAIRPLPFYLEEIGKFFAGEAYFTKRSGRSGYYLVFTREGLGRLHMDGAELDIPQGSALLVPCAPLHNYHTVGERWVHLWMHLDGDGVEAYHAILQGRPVALELPDEFARRFEDLITRARSIDVAAAARISHSLSALLTDLVTSGLQAAGQEGSERHAAVEEALRFLREHYQQPISIEDITRQVNLSKYHFVRLFRRHVGMTPYNYLLHYRVNQSKRLLCTTDDSVGEIAQQVGYGSASNYVDQFRRITGMTPAQFRRGNLNYLEISGREPDTQSE